MRNHYGRYWGLPNPFGADNKKMPNKRDILEALGRGDLTALVERFEVEAKDRRSKTGLVEALAGAKKPKLDALLNALAPSSLKDCCEALGLDGSSRQKSVLILRLMREDGRATTSSKAKPPSSAKATKPSKSAPKTAARAASKTAAKTAVKTAAKTPEKAAGKDKGKAQDSRDKSTKVEVTGRGKNKGQGKIAVKGEARGVVRSATTAATSAASTKDKLRKGTPVAPASSAAHGSHRGKSGAARGAAVSEAGALKASGHAGARRGRPPKAAAVREQEATASKAAAKAAAKSSARPSAKASARPTPKAVTKAAAKLPTKAQATAAAKAAAKEARAAEKAAKAEAKAAAKAAARAATKAAAQAAAESAEAARGKALAKGKSARAQAQADKQAEKLAARAAKIAAAEAAKQAAAEQAAAAKPRLHTGPIIRRRSEVEAARAVEKAAGTPTLIAAAGPVFTSRSTATPVLSPAPTSTPTPPVSSPAAAPSDPLRAPEASLVEAPSEPTTAQAGDGGEGADGADGAEGTGEELPKLNPNFYAGPAAPKLQRSWFANDPTPPPPTPTEQVVKCQSCRKKITMKQCQVQRCTNWFVPSASSLQVCADCLFERGQLTFAEFQQKMEEQSRCPHCGQPYQKGDATNASNAHPQSSSN